MNKRKTLKELTISDNFLFGAVMSDEENCRLLLERILGFAIAQVYVSEERRIAYHPEYKSIRLDIYAKDDKNTCYNVEMQTAKKTDLGKRSRYYHSQMDMELLLKGKSYSELAKAYVIFICDFDPFEKRKYCYTFRNTCQEDESAELEDGSITIFLSTKGENRKEVTPELERFLAFTGADLADSEKDFQDDFVERLQNSIRKVKEDREMEERYMLLQEMLKEERGEGKEEGRKEGRSEGLLFSLMVILQKLGEFPEELQQRIMSEKDPEVLQKWISLAVRAESLEIFQKNM